MIKKSPLQTEIPFEALDPKRIHMESSRKQALDQGRTRLLVTGVVFAMAFVVLGGRLVDLTRHGKDGAPKWQAMSSSAIAAPVVTRGDVRDRNGHILATSLPTKSLYVDSRETLRGIRADEAADKLMSVMPELDRAQVLARIKSGGRQVWLARNLTPDQVWSINSLGIPGFGFRDEEQRVYPFGPTFAHVLGYTDVDGKGIAGMERTFQSKLGTHGESIDLSIDMRVQAVLHEELGKAKDKFDAVGAAGVVMDVKTGEILAMASLPDFDPNTRQGSLGDAGFNRVTKGVYEMGSTFKLFNTAMALDTGTVGMSDGYDASEPIRVSRFTISDYHAKNRWLSVPEILVHSSNIGSAKMALDVGAKKQKEYLRRFGLLGSTDVELPEVGNPLYPARWGDISTMTISYGHGIAVSPLQVAAGVSALINGGVMITPTLVKRSDDNPVQGKRVLKAKTSDAMRRLMRKVVRDGTGGNAEVKGYLVGGKTGTAEKQVSGGYDKKTLISSFVGAFPMTNPRFVVLVVVDEPKGIKESYGYATGGWVAAPAVGGVIERLGPIFGVVPDQGSDDAEENPEHPLYVPVSNGPKQTAWLRGGLTHAAY
ncbi:MAG: penicillin-binding protein 2 [Magnetovibrio sp.]|nr:penicillin-binding protein 2 [Magnetovibrio sp.]